MRKSCTMIMPLLLAVFLLVGCGIRVNVNPRTPSLADMLAEQALVADPAAFNPDGSYAITFRYSKGGFDHMDLSQAYVAYDPYSVPQPADGAQDDIPPLPKDARDAIAQAVGADRLEKLAVIRIETVDDRTLIVSFVDPGTAYPEKEYYFVIPNEGIAGSVLPEYHDAGPAGRQDGERFEAVIILEGMEETVHYEHLRNDTLGFEMDYDYESFVRHSETDRELFVSCWDDPDHPENYLELRCSPQAAETVAANICAFLSGEYEVRRDDAFPLEQAGRCIRIYADEVKGGGYMPEHLQIVNVIPAGDGCRIAAEHSYIVESEGFGRRFRYMMDSFSVLAARGEKRLTDEQAVSAIRNYCCIRDSELGGILKAGDYPVYWSVSSSDEKEIAVVFRSYTGALDRYYIDPVSGDARVTEFVPGITDGEQRTDESLNVWDYLF